MPAKQQRIQKQPMYLLTAWLAAVSAEYALLPEKLKDLAGLDGLAQMSGLRMVLVGGAVLLLLNWLGHRLGGMERWLPGAAFAVYASAAVIRSFTWPFLFACGAMLALLVCYGARGWEASPEQVADEGGKPIWLILTVAFGVGFFVLVSVWTVARVWSFNTPTFDFGIFSQMFHNMKQTGLQLTTVERDKELTHFAVHFSPIYYLMLPIYWVFPRPETLQVLQAAVMASAVIPLWKLGKRHGLAPGLRFALCLLLLVYPAYAGGARHDLHENCFLTPLLLWLMLAVDNRNLPQLLAAMLLTLAVKEDAPVYVAVVALYLMLRGLLRDEQWERRAGLMMLAGAVAWFLLATAYLTRYGEGVMNYRYKNFMFNGSDSLATVVIAVILCPLKAVYECVDGEKLGYIGLTMLPLVGLPLATRRYERLVLLIPYLLVNLMSDYTYQHDILFQYQFGSIALLFYLAAANLGELNIRRSAALLLAICIGLGCFQEEIAPLMRRYITYCVEKGERYDAQREKLDTIPAEASVAATTFYTTYLSNRSQLWDIHYGKPAHILACEYVAIQVTDTSAFSKYEQDGKNGRENFIAQLQENGFVLVEEIPDVLEIYQKQEMEPPVSEMEVFG